MVVISFTVIYCIFAILVAVAGLIFLIWPVLRMADENEQPIWTSRKLVVAVMGLLFFILAPFIVYLLIDAERIDLFVLQMYEELTVEEF